MSTPAGAPSVSLATFLDRKAEPHTHGVWNHICLTLLLASAVTVACQCCQWHMSNCYMGCKSTLYSTTAVLLTRPLHSFRSVALAFFKFSTVSCSCLYTATLCGSCMKSIRLVSWSLLSPSLMMLDKDFPILATNCAYTSLGMLSHRLCATTCVYAARQSCRSTSACSWLPLLTSKTSRFARSSSAASVAAADAASL